jgi:hypothetical protein
MRKVNFHAIDKNIEDLFLGNFLHIKRVNVSSYDNLQKLFFSSDSHSLNAALFFSIFFGFI